MQQITVEVTDWAPGDKAESLALSGAWCQCAHDNNDGHVPINGTIYLVSSVEYRLRIEANGVRARFPMIELVGLKGYWSAKRFNRLVPISQR